MPERRVLVALSLCLLAAALDILGFVGFGLFPLTWIALVPVLIAVRDVAPRRTFLYALFFGAIANAGGYYWVAQMIREFGSMSAFLGVLALALLCIYQGLSFALLFYLVRRAKTDLGIAPVWSLAVAYPAIELAFPLLFPYYIGNSQYRFTAITQIVELTGLLGLTSLIGIMNGAAYELVESRLEKRRPVTRRLAIAFGAFAVVLLYGLIRTPMIDGRIEAAKKLKVAMIQANLGAGEKHEKMSEFIERHREMSRAVSKEHPDVDLIVWPETAYNMEVPRDEKAFAARLGQGIDKPMVLGMLTFEKGRSGRRQIYNSAISTSSTGEMLSRFDKVELLAFGETIPFIDTFPWLASWFPETSLFERGKTFAHLKNQKPPAKLLPMICYEDIFPAFVRKMWGHAGPADALINLTNDSWYGDSHEPLIHLALASFRSIETRRSLIRSTNTGISAIVDPAGRIIARSGQWTKETVIADVPLITDGSSPLYERTGNAFGWIALAATLFGFFKADAARKKTMKAESKAATQSGKKKKKSKKR
jgi:apolipoprotein N-acyltransferase